MAESFAEILGKLETEHQMLCKLLYRNRNQHRTTHLFSYLLSSSRALKILFVRAGKDELVLLRAHHDALKFQSNAARIEKAGSDELQKAVSLHSTLCAMRNVCVCAFKRSFRAAIELQIQLAKRVFPALFSLLYALTARLVRYLALTAVELERHEATIMLHLQVH